MKPAESLQSTSPQMVSPPSVILKGAFQCLQHYPATEAEIEETAKQALLTRQETEMWFEHLHTIRENRKRGSSHAAATRRQRKEQKEKETQESLHTTVLHVPLLTKSSVTQWKTGLDASCVTLGTILFVLELIILAFPTNFFLIIEDELSVCIVYSMCSCFYGTLLVYSQTN